MSRECERTFQYLPDWFLKEMKEVERRDKGGMPEKAAPTPVSTLDHADLSIPPWERTRADVKPSSGSSRPAYQPAREPPREQVVRVVHESVVTQDQGQAQESEETQVVRVVQSGAASGRNNTRNQQNNKSNNKQNTNQNTKQQRRPPKLAFEPQEPPR